MTHDPQCCNITDGVYCPSPSVFWVGRNGVDDYTYACATHLLETRKLFAPDGVAISLRLLAEGNTRIVRRMQ